LVLGADVTVHAVRPTGVGLLRNLV
jgi:hypothetical protein